MKNGIQIPISNLKKIRTLDLKLNQSDAAKFYDCDYKTYRSYEKGDIKNASGSRLIDMKKRLADKGINVTVDYLLGVSEWRSPENDYIGTVTGLNDKAINVLISDKKRPLHIIDTLNLLLGHIDIRAVPKLFLDIYMFLLTTPKYFKSLDGTFKGDYVILESDFENINYPALRGLGVGLYSENVGGVFLQNITSHLSTIKSELEK